MGNPETKKDGGGGGVKPLTGPCGVPLDKAEMIAGFARARIAGREPHECEAEAVRAYLDRVCKDHGCVGSTIFRIHWGTAATRIGVQVLSIFNGNFSLVSEGGLFFLSNEAGWDWESIETLLVKQCQTKKWLESKGE